MKEQIQVLISQNPKQYIRKIKSNQEYMYWIEQNCDPDCNSIDIKSKIYTFITLENYEDLLISKKDLLFVEIYPNVNRPMKLIHSEPKKPPKIGTKKLPKQKELKQIKKNMALKI